MDKLKCQLCYKEIEGFGRFIFNGNKVCETCFDKEYKKKVNLKPISFF
jgi:hypothetical protein